jgi:hypothetical protein
MMLSSKSRPMAVVVGVAVTSLALAACGGGDGGGGGDASTLTFLVDNSEDTVAQAEALADGFNEQSDGITVEVETRPQGGEGDNVVKTRLSTGDMTDVFMYNSGSLFQALNPSETMAPVGDEEWVGSLQEEFVQSVTADDQVYGAPWGPFQAGGMMYHIPTYEELGLEVPKTWDQFMANNEKIKAAGKTPVIETFGETWTSQLLVLGDFHNVAAEEPNFAEDYTAGKAKYGDTPAATRGFEHLQDVYEAGYMNEDFASANLLRLGQLRGRSGHGRAGRGCPLPDPERRDRLDRRQLPRPGRRRRLHGDPGRRRVDLRPDRLGAQRSTSRRRPRATSWKRPSSSWRSSPAPRAARPSVRPRARPAPTPSRAVICPRTCHRR